MSGVTTLTVTMIMMITAAVAAVVECYQGKYETKLGTELDLCSNPVGQQTFSVRVR